MVGRIEQKFPREAEIILLDLLAIIDSTFIGSKRSHFRHLSLFLYVLDRFCGGRSLAKFTIFTFRSFELFVKLVEESGVNISN